MQIKFEIWALPAGSALFCIIYTCGKNFLTKGDCCD